MFTSVTVIHVIFCVVLILAILLQTGSGADMGAIFGGSSQTAFGSRGAGTFLSKTTTGVAILFMVTSLVLAVMGRKTHSVMDSVSESPAVPIRRPPTALPITAPAAVKATLQTETAVAHTPESAEKVSPKAVSGEAPAPVASKPADAPADSPQATAPAPIEEKQPEPEAIPSD